MEIPASFFKVSFNKAMAFGYKTEDVDGFVTQAIQYIKDLQEEQHTLLEKMAVLAQSLEKYREEEDSLRSALVGAQKLGDSILRDCRGKAETILRDATNRADKVTQDAALELERTQYELDRVKAETTDFKEKLFSLYRTHLDHINHIPSSREVAQRHRNTPPPAPAPEPVPEPEPVQPPPPAQEQAPQDAYRPGGTPKQSYKDTYADSFEEPVQYTTAPVEDEPLEDNAEEAYEFPQEPATEDDFAQSDYDENSFDEEALEQDDFNNQPAPEYQPVYTQNHEVQYQQEQAEYYQEPAQLVTVAASAQDAEEDIALYTPRRSVQKAAPAASVRSVFEPQPMVQMEFFDGDEHEEDEFFEDSRSLRSVDLNKIPYFDDEDEDEEAFPPPTHSKHRISKKFGELKFGESFSLTDD